MIIYKITNNLNGKIYIGQTVQNLVDRWSDHSRPHIGKHKPKSAIAQAIQKYGKENFKIEQIDEASSLEELNIKEQTYIKAFNTLAPNGYNLELGGGNKHCHEETKIKISQTLKGRPIKNRMNGAPKGRPVSEERRKRISDTLKGRPAKQNNEPVKDTLTGVMYESQKEASKKLNVSRQTINKWTKKGRIIKI